MLNITSTEREQVLLIPRNGYGPLDAEGLVLSATSTSDTAPAISLPIIGCEVVGAFFRVSIELPKALHKGEWEYCFRQGDVVISSGILMVGVLPGRSQSSVQYNRETEYREYEGT